MINPKLAIAKNIIPTIIKVSIFDPSELYNIVQTFFLLTYTDIGEFIGYTFSIVVEVLEDKKLSD